MLEQIGGLGPSTGRTLSCLTWYYHLQTCTPMLYTCSLQWTTGQDEAKYRSDMTAACISLSSWSSPRVHSHHQVHNVADTLTMCTWRPETTMNNGYTDQSSLPHVTWWSMLPSIQSSVTSVWQAIKLHAMRRGQPKDNPTASCLSRLSRWTLLDAELLPLLGSQSLSSVPLTLPSICTRARKAAPCLPKDEDEECFDGMNDGFCNWLVNVLLV